MNKKKLLACICAAAMTLTALPSVSLAEQTEALDDYLLYYASFDSEFKADKGGNVKVNGNVTIKDNAAYFPNAANSYLMLTDENGADKLLVGQSELTITFKEKRESGKWPLFMAPSTASPSYNNSENYIGLYDDDAFRLERYVGARNQGTSSSVANNDYKSSNNSGEWRNVAIVLTDASSAVYINGEKVGETASTSKLDALFANNSVIALGHAYWGSGESYGGYIDEFKIYNKALSAEDIVAMSSITADMIKKSIELDITAPVKTDITLPSQSYGMNITWTSSDEAVISSEGKVTRQYGDRKVTLTASVSYKGETITKDFDVTVASLPTADIVLENVTIDSPDRILDSLDLMAEYEGVEIKWTSSNPDVITDMPKANGDYTIPAGFVTRGDADQNVTLTAEVTVNDETKTKSFDLTVKAAKAEEEKVAYLYAYFRGNVNGGVEHLQIHVATSKDGYVWTDLNGNWPILTSTMGTTGLRDPYIIRSRYGDKFYLIATDLNTLDGQGWGPWSLAGSKYLAVWESEDLVNWSEQRLVKFANDDIGCAWAPEAIYDEDTGEYLVYAAGKDLTMANPADTVYVVRTRDFKSFSEPEYFNAPVDNNGNRIWAIDSSIIKADDGKYYQFYKHSNSQIRMLVADHASGPYTEVTAFTPIGGEGPAEYKVNGTDTYCLCVDNYSVYVPYLTDDIASGKFTKSDANVIMPTGSKHGTMVPVTQKEYDDLLRVYGPAKTDEAGVDAFLKYDFESETEGLMGNAAITDDEEKGSKVLTLDGTNGTYFEIPADAFKHKDTLTVSMDIKNQTSNGNCFTFAMGTNDRFYYYFKDTATEVKTAITNGGYENNWEQTSNASFSVSNIDKWEHFDLVITPENTKVYKNGKIVAQKDTTLTLSHTGIDNLKVYLGKSFYEADPYFKGSFDNVKFYNRALSETEILENMGTTDEEIVKLDADAVSFGQDINNVKGNITLPSTGIYGSSISWESSNPEFIDLNGNVTIPTKEQGDKGVILSATFTKGDATLTKEYTLIIKTAKETWNSTADWTAHQFDSVSGEVYINFDITPNSLSDGYIGISSSAAQANAWDKCNIIIRIQPQSNGKFDAHNGSGYAATNDISYEPNKTYHIAIKANTVSKTFSAYVTDENGTTTVLAQNFAYRDKTGSDLSKIVVRGGDKVAANLYSVSGFSASNYPVYIDSAMLTSEKSIISCQNLAPDAQASILVAAYDADGNLLNVNASTLKSNEYVTIENAVPENCEYIKIFAWNKDILLPLAKAVKITK